MKIPDVIGYTYDRARIKLQDSGYVINKVVTTSPPREKSSEYHDFYRVIRVRSIKDFEVEVLVCNLTSK